MVLIQSAHNTVKMTGHLALQIFLFCCSIYQVHSDDAFNSFIVDVMEEFRLILPTIIFAADAVPQLCIELKWVLCLDSSQNDAALIAEHLKILHLTRKQDGVIFADNGNGMSTLVEEVSNLVPTLFRSPCPVFMPLDHARLIELRLDSNVLFYNRENDQGYMLLDKYAFKGGPPMTKELGSWRATAGLELYASTNRWNRRNDLE